MNNSNKINVFAHVQDEKCENSSRTEYEFSEQPRRHFYDDVYEYYYDLIRYYEERDMYEEADEIAYEYPVLFWQEDFVQIVDFITSFES